MSLIIPYWARQVVSNGSEQDRNVPCVHTDVADRARDPPGLQHYAHLEADHEYNIDVAVSHQKSSTPSCKVDRAVFGEGADASKSS